MKKKHRILFFYIMLFIGLLVRILLPLSDFNHLQKWNSDDMYYYLDIAKNIADNGNPTVDGINLTNGFHPLFMVILVLVFKLIKDNLYLPINIALIILALFNFATTYYIYKLTELVSSRRAATVAVFIWLFNPFVMFITYSGVEVPISGFFLIGSFYYYLLYKKQNKTADFTKTSIFSGLAFLGRTDSLFLLAIIAFDMFIFEYIKNKEKFILKKFFLSFKKSALYSLIIFIIVLPWFIWNIIHFGSIIQSSATAVSFRSHQVFLGLNGSYFNFNLLLEVTKWFLLWIYKILNFFGSPPLMGFIWGLLLSIIIRKSINTKYKLALIVSSILIIGGSKNSINSVYNIRYIEGVVFDFILSLILFLLGVYIGLSTNSKINERKSFLKENYLFIIWGIIVISFYSLYLWHYQIWYSYSLYIVITIIVAQLVYHKGFLFTKWVFLFLALLFLYKGTVLFQNAYPNVNPYFFDEDKIRCFKEFEVNNPAVKLGSFDSGKMSYLIAPSLVNLDGVANNNVNIALHKRELITYLHDQNIKFLFDGDERIKEYSLVLNKSLFSHLEKAEVCGIQVYRVV